MRSEFRFTQNELLYIIYLDMVYGAKNVANKYIDIYEIEVKMNDENWNE